MSLLTKALGEWGGGPMLSKSALTVAKGTQVLPEREAGIKKAQEAALLHASPLTRRYFSDAEIVQQAADAEKAAKASGPFSVATETDMAAHAAASSPLNSRQATDAQIAAGNYKKGSVTVSGLRISIENPEGSTRSSQPGAAEPWKRTIVDAHYGYLRGVVGQDKDHLDIFLKPATSIDWSGDVYVIHQVNQDSGGFDEHKVMVGYPSEAQATAAYQANYPPGWTVGKVEAMSLQQFKAWTESGSVVQRLFGSQRAVKFEQPAPFLSKGGPGSGPHPGTGSRRQTMISGGTEANPSLMSPKDAAKHGFKTSDDKIEHMFGWSEKQVLTYEREVRRNEGKLTASDRIHDAVYGKTADGGDLEKDITVGTGLSTPQAGLTHYTRRKKKKESAAACPCADKADPPGQLTVGTFLTRSKQ